MEDIYRDAIELCDKAIRTKDLRDMISPREISIESSVDTLNDRSFLHYKYIEIVTLLETARIISIVVEDSQDNTQIDKWMSGFSKSTNKNSELHGYFKVYFDYEAAQDWINNQIQRIENPIKPTVFFPEGRDYLYENKQLHVLMSNGTTASIDFSNSTITEPFFNVIYTLLLRTNKNFFSREDITQEYKQIYKENMEWSRSTTYNIGNIKNKINNSILSKRIIFEFDRKENAYHFEILPVDMS